MNSTDYQLRPLESCDLRKVSILHRKAFKDSALTKLGLEPIRRYYEWQLTGPHECYAVGVFDEAQDLLGFCFSGVFHGSLSGFLAGNKKFLIAWIFTHPWVIFNPLVIDRIKNTIHPLKKKQTQKTEISKEVKRSFGVLSIAVDPTKRGIGIGKMIMDSVEHEAMNNGFSHMHLTVHPSNISAISFYERCGWKRSNSGGGEWTGYMTKCLCV